MRIVLRIYTQIVNDLASFSYSHVPASINPSMAGGAAIGSRLVNEYKVDPSALARQHSGDDVNVEDWGSLKHQQAK